MRLIRTAILFSILSAGSIYSALAQDKLIVYTYDSFTSKWGPGPVIQQAFQAECHCEVEFISVADGVALLNRLKLEGKNTRADIVLGLDTNLTHEAKATSLFAEHGLELSDITVPGGFTDDIFVPYDYSYFAFVYDTTALANPPKSLKELVDATDEPKILIQDPRTSTPGLGLVLWVKAVYGDDAAQAWEKLRSKVITVTPGWSEAYGLFTKGEAPMVLSYTTSPAYHLIEENSKRYAAAPFEEGHYLQIEVAAMTVKGNDNPTARQFLSFMTGPGFQDIIPETNWMLPAGKTSKPLNPAFDLLVKPEISLLLSSEEVADNHDSWIKEWLKVMSR